MNQQIKFSLVLILLSIGLTAAASGQAITKPRQILSEIVRGMPAGKDQEVRVLTAEFKPGDKTVFHEHRFPVTIYILEGAFTLNLEGRKEPLVIKAGEAYVEPPNVKMTGYNRSPNGILRLVIFYVSDPDAPFLDPVEMPGMPKVK